jgi:hypothetical protein
VSDGEEIYRISIVIDANPGRELHIPSALDAGVHPAWRCPPPGHGDPWGMTRDLRTDAAAEPELLAHPDGVDGLVAEHVGKVQEPPSDNYLLVRIP